MRAPLVVGLSYRADPIRLTQRTVFRDPAWRETARGLPGASGRFILKTSPTLPEPDYRTHFESWLNDGRWAAEPPPCEARAFHVGAAEYLATSQSIRAFHLCEFRPSPIC